jgi:ankyrin repeat protein
MSEPSDSVVDDFMCAVMDGRIDAAREHLRRDASLANTRNPKAFGATPLNHAAARRNLELIDLLLEYGADINAKSDWWAGPFGVLHSIPGDAIHLKDDLGDETMGGRVSKHLIERGAIVDVHAAANLGMLDRLRELLDADPSLIEAPGGDGRRPLHFARSVPIAAFLLERGAELESRDIDHESTPAQWAASDRGEVARYLVERGAAPDPIMAAAIGDLDLLRRTIAEEPDGARLRITDERFPCAGDRAAGHIYMFTFGRNATPLHAVASCRGTAEAARFLIETGADPLARGGYDDGTPLHMAAWNDNAVVMEVLLDSGADIEVRSGPMHHNTPLGWAIVGGAVNVVELLLRRGAAVHRFHVEDAEAGVAGEFTKWSCAPRANWERIAEMVARAAGAAGAQAMPQPPR